MAIRDVKKRAAKAPTDAKDARNPMATALSVAVMKKIIKAPNPASASNKIIPTEMTRKALQGPPQ